MKNKLLFINVNVIFFIHIISFLKLIKVSEEICNRDNPILKSNKCDLTYCLEEEYNSGVCQINNEIIKTQWLTNIIKVGNIKFRYTNFASYSNGDMIFLTSANPKQNQRIFYGFQKNGRPFLFDNINENEYLFSIEINQSCTDGKYESESLVIKSSINGENNQNEYLLSLSKKDSFVEIYDFEKEIVYQKNLKIFTDNIQVESFRHTLMPLISNDKNNSNYIFGFGGGSKFHIQIHRFDNIQNFENEKTLQKTKTMNFKSFCGRSGISCFQTIKQIIMCFYLEETPNYIIIAYDNKLEEKKRIYYDFIYNQKCSYDMFYKCIHLKDEIGIFSSYLNLTNKMYPVLFLKNMIIILLI